MPLQNYKGYTVDYRLKQFRFVHPEDCGCGHGIFDIDFIEFDSEKGAQILSDMIRDDELDQESFYMFT